MTRKVDDVSLEMMSHSLYLADYRLTDTAVGSFFRQNQKSKKVFYLMRVTLRIIYPFLQPHVRMMFQAGCLPLLSCQ